MNKKYEYPYILTSEIVVHKHHNPNYGDYRRCRCGHPYQRHFDPYENMEACGCKYCLCYDFVETSYNLDYYSSVASKLYVLYGSEYIVDNSIMTEDDRGNVYTILRAKTTPEHEQAALHTPSGEIYLVSRNTMPYVGFNPPTS